MVAVQLINVIFEFLGMLLKIGLESLQLFIVSLYKCIKFVHLGYLSFSGRAFITSDTGKQTQVKFCYCMIRALLHCIPAIAGLILARMFITPFYFIAVAVIKMLMGKFN
jgi:hypothetical protein